MVHQPIGHPAQRVSAGHTQKQPRRLLASGTSVKGWLAISIILIVTDVAALATAFVLAYLLRFKTRIGVFYVPPESPLRFYSTLVFWLLPLVTVIFAFYRLYRPSYLFDSVDEYTRIVSAATTSMLMIILVSFVLDSGIVISRGWILISWITVIGCVALNRFLFRRFVYALRRGGRIAQRVLLLGSGQSLIDLAAQIRTSPESGIQIVTVIDAQNDAVDANQFDLERVIKDTRADAVIIPSGALPQPLLRATVAQIAGLDCELQIVPEVHEILTTGVRVREIRGLPLVTVNKVRITGFDLLLKRSLDCIVASAALLILSPVLIAVTFAIRLTSPGPILYRRRVVGQQKTSFEALKFRTMYVDGEQILARHPDLANRLAAEGKLVSDPRLTPIGAWLRRWSLDELPQLLNVLRGQMSLVGPRMITEAELPHFGDWRDNLYTVRPGLTGLWQVSGRSNLGYDDRVRLDMHYIRTYSIWIDIEILLRTIPAVLSGRGAY